MTPEERNAEILRLWEERVVSGEIASRLKISRNTVMGVVSRAQKKGLASKHDYTKRPEAERKPQPERKPPTVAVRRLEPVLVRREEPMPKMVVPPPPEPPAKPHRSKSIMQLKALDCRFILPDGRYCAKEARSMRTPWCKEHYALVYQPVRKAQGRS